MNFDFSDEQKFLRSEARKFLESAWPAARARGVVDDAAQSHDADMWRALAEQGWLGIAIPEPFGGLGLSRIDLCVIAEELGRVLAPVPFASTLYFLAEAVMLAGTADQQADILPRIVAGELIGAFASSEGPGVPTPATLRTTVSGGKLTGVKLPVTDGGIADLCVVLASEEGKPGLFLVDLNGPGVSRETLKTLDPSRGAARIAFTDAPATPLGAPGAGFDLAEQLLDRAAVLLAFEQVGLSDRCLEMARDFALERYAFGRVIGSYQAIKHKLADMYINNTLARSNAYYGAWALGTGAAELAVAAAAARVSACHAAAYAARENIQTHGGIGYTWESDCHLYYRRARQLGLVAGASIAWKERLVGRLEQRNAA